MIQSFKGKSTEELWLTGKSKKLESTILRVTLRKLWQIDNAVSLDDLKAPPNNHLESLKADRKGQYSIRINKRWRICFIWDEGHAHEVEIVDYH